MRWRLGVRRIARPMGVGPPPRLPNRREGIGRASLTACFCRASSSGGVPRGAWWQHSGMRLRERVIVAVAAIGAPIVLAALVAGSAAQVSVFLGVIVAEGLLWVLHTQVVVEAESRAYRDGHQDGYEECEEEWLLAD